MVYRLTLFSALLGLVASSPAFAQGNPEAGRVKADTCLGCHGQPNYKNVYPTYSVPKLGGQHAQYLISALSAYRSGERSHTTMRAQASSLSDQDITDIAAYFSGLTP